MELVKHFLRTDIYDRDKVNYACTQVGIPQGSPVSPVLIHFFLHQLDKGFESLEISVQGPEEDIEWSLRIYYARYADDILFGIPRAKEIPVPFQVKDQQRRILLNACGRFQFHFSWVEFARVPIIGGRKSSPLEVLGLVVSLSPGGQTKVSIQMKKWQQRLTCNKIRGLMKLMCSPNAMGYFIVVMNIRIRTYFQSSDWNWLVPVPSAIA